MSDVGIGMKLFSLLRYWNDERKGDKALNIKTTGRDDSGSDKHHHPYEPTPYSVLERLACAGHISSGNTLMDYGCGKGRAALFLSQRTGCKAIGVEYDEDFFQAAEENKRCITSGIQVKFILQSAEKCPVPKEVDRFYFFNPFSVETLQEVMEQIRRSRDAAPRQILLFFYYPSEKYLNYLSAVRFLQPMEDIECMDLFPDDDDRERVLVYALTCERQKTPEVCRRMGNDVKGSI